ncbi:NAD(P)H-dependent oxidoreductase [Sphingobacterium alkalisoli]|uniref:NAD(P)H-dependent oxidoreductase n=1 Tax=Sphingobacterium alkalisoli TaxID=1874115 RepID=A0A4U0H515_9SPHI|nr:NAD(P)H-dependent oxidoreductase [Sphingobacterium alkalisoli]TJY66780.1 NAD(P)H-dependent oxidoreductase [Sphingobacterium alkalisoli]GGH14266.1 nitroreductase [Sphingobacterium alkalisoli]
MNLQDTLSWRYAVKKYSDLRVEDDKIRRILEATNLSASSVGLQPYRVLVVENKELRKQLGEGSFNTQIAEASHLLVFAAYANIDQAMIDDYMARTAAIRSTPLDQLTDFKSKLESFLLARPADENFSWAARQTYIALGTALIAAAAEKVDTTPMEGFDAAQVDRILGLTEKGLRSVVLLAVGYRDEAGDWLASLPKVRLDVEEFAPVVG